MNKVYMSDSTLARFKQVSELINTWSKEEYIEFTETQLLEICVGFTLAAILGASSKQYAIVDFLKTAIVAANNNRMKNDE